MTSAKHEVRAVATIAGSDVRESRAKPEDDRVTSPTATGARDWQAEGAVRAVATIASNKEDSDEPKKDDPDRTDQSRHGQIKQDSFSSPGYL